MKKKLIALLVTLSCFGFAGQVLAAQVSSFMDVYVDITGACSMYNDMVYSVNGQPTSTFVDVTCAPNVPYAIAFDAGQNYNGAWRQVSDGINVGEYGLFYTGIEVSDVGYGDTYPYGDPITGIGSGVNDNYIVDFSLLTDPGLMPPGFYYDSVVVTLNY